MITKRQARGLRVVASMLRTLWRNRDAIYDAHSAMVMLSSQGEARVPSKIFERYAKATEKLALIMDLFEREDWGKEDALTWFRFVNELYDQVAGVPSVFEEEGDEAQGF